MKLQIIRRLVRKVFLIAFILFSFVLIFVGKPDSKIIATTGGLVLDIMTPVVSVVAYPIYKVKSFFADVREYRRVDRRNEELRAEVSRLKEEINLLKSGEAEHRQLAKLCNFHPGGTNYILVTRVLAASGAGLSHSFILDAGARDGVKKYHAVLVDGYLVGQIVAVGDKYSRMLLITDASSRIPVQVERTGTRAFLAGDNSRYPGIVHFENQERLELGDRMMTSGMDGNIPYGIPVGTVGSISEEDGVVLQPYVDSSRIGYVKVIKTSHTEDVKEFIEESPVVE
jgi:rod shape-determining protein MreC